MRGWTVLVLGLLLVAPGCGGSTSNAEPPPQAGGIMPVMGTQLGGETVTVTGANFDATPGGTTVTFGGSQASDVVVENSGLLTCTTPPGVRGPVDVTVYTFWGGSTLPGAYTYLPPASLLATAMDGRVWEIDVLTGARAPVDASPREPTDAHEAVDVETIDAFEGRFPLAFGSVVGIDAAHFALAAFEYGPDVVYGRLAGTATWRPWVVLEDLDVVDLFRARE